MTDTGSTERLLDVQVSGFSETFQAVIDKVCVYVGSLLCSVRMHLTYCLRSRGLVCDCKP